MVQQVTPVAVLMIVQGALEILLGLILIGAAFIIPIFFEEMVRQQGGPNPFGQLPGGAGFFGIVYGSMGAAGLVPGIFRVFAGIRNLSFRGRTLGIISQVLGLLSIGTCYCSITSIGLAIYGLIVYFNQHVVRAFALGEEGLSAAEIKARFFFGGYRDPEDRTAAEEEYPQEPGTKPPDAGRDDYRIKN